MKKVIIALLLSIANCQLSTAQVGTWRNYLAYYDVQQIQAAGNELFVLASNDLYQYNKNDQSIVTYDKTNGLSDTYISNIKWCQQAKRLVAVYGNTNIDLVETNGNVTNISDIYTKVITGDKTINSIYIHNQYAYLACGFGIVKLNVKDAEISESYMLGFPVTAITISGNTLYAQTSQGVLAANLNTNLIDKSNWQTATTAPSFDEDTSDYDENIQLVKTLQPGGPKYNNFYFMRFLNNSLYTCGGLYHPLTDLDRPGTIQVLNNNEWTIYQDSIDKITGYRYIDLDCLDVDPNDNNHVFASGRTGLYEFLNGVFVKAYTFDNSELKSTFANDKNYVIVNALKFDKDGNLWMIQSLNTQNKLMMLSKDGKWTKIDYNLFNSYGSVLKSTNVLGNARNIFFDSKGYLWFANDHYDTPAIYRYDINNNKSIEYVSFINQDGATVNASDGVACLAEDKDNNLWIATSYGPLVLEPDQIENSNPTFTQVKVPRNDGTNYADYLLSGINISCMDIDGGNRKWFGTKTLGVYLISSDNSQQIYHFTTENSPLLSDNIESIAINQKTGEVFIGTDKGLCSFMSDATTPNNEMNKDNVWAYPNPVTPDYTGLITITGLSLDADVKIVASNGALIAEGRSNGGFFTWDGNDQKGRRVASGVYMVVTATSNGEKGTVCKIAIVN